MKKTQESDDCPIDRGISSQFWGNCFKWKKGFRESARKLFDNAIKSGKESAKENPANAKQAWKDAEPLFMWSFTVKADDENKYHLILTGINMEGDLVEITRVTSLLIGKPNESGCVMELMCLNPHRNYSAENKAFRIYKLMYYHAESEYARTMDILTNDRRYSRMHHDNVFDYIEEKK